VKRMAKVKRKTYKGYKIFESGLTYREAKDTQQFLLARGNLCRIVKRKDSRYDVYYKVPLVRMI
jgi:hypothetical protein